jgi:uncharacterized protein (DUF1800 family)
MTASTSDISDVAHLLRRAGFGPTPSQLDAAVQAGYSTTVDALLTWSGGDPADSLSPPSQMSWYPPEVLAGNPETDANAADLRRQFVASQRQLLVPLVQWWLERMRVSTNPLREKLTLNLHNNFATAISKVQLPLLMFNQNQTIRSMASGSFEALTQALAKDPAMMIWLDTQTDKVGHPNENFARELMERFTMGVGNYTQQDVEEGARAFTGWSIDRATGAYRFNPAQFDSGVKTYLGQTGPFTGEDIVHIATNTDASHRWVASRMWSFFAYPVATDDPIVVNDLVPTYSANLSLSDLMRTIFLHPDFTSTQAKTGLVKQPVEWVVGIHQALSIPFVSGSTSSGGKVDPGRLAVEILHGLGQVPFDPPNVGGWPQNQYWLSTASSLYRWKYATVVPRLGDISKVEEASPGDRPDAVAELLGVTDGWSDTTAKVLQSASSDPATLTTMALVSPEYVSN